MMIGERELITSVIPTGVISNKVYEALNETSLDVVHRDYIKSYYRADDGVRIGDVLVLVEIFHKEITNLLPIVIVSSEDSLEYKLAPLKFITPEELKLEVNKKKWYKITLK